LLTRQITYVFLIYIWLFQIIVLRRVGFCAECEEGKEGGCPLVERCGTAHHEAVFGVCVTPAILTFTSTMICSICFVNILYKATDISYKKGRCIAYLYILRAYVSGGVTEPDF
jgi:hypothetical protein